MSLLLDTHAVLWWLAGQPLRPEAHERIADPDQEAFVSAASIWEAGIKAALGRLRVEGSLVAAVADAGFDLLAVNGEHAEAAASLPPHHRDPFDRMLVAQARLERLTLVSRDPWFSRYDVEVLAC